MRCPRCGHRSVGASWYCRNCGAAYGDLNVADSIGRSKRPAARLLRWSAALLVVVAGVALLMGAGSRLRGWRGPGKGTQDAPSNAADGATRREGTAVADNLAGETAGILTGNVPTLESNPASNPHINAAGNPGSNNGTGAGTAAPPRGGPAPGVPIPGGRATVAGTHEPGYQAARPQSPPEVSWNAYPADPSAAVDSGAPVSGTVADRLRTDTSAGGQGTESVAGAPPPGDSSAVRTRPDAPVWHIPFRANPPKQDGWLNDWSGAQLDLSAVVFGQEHWDGPADLSAKGNGAWNNKALYLGMRVVDDVFVQTSHGEALFLGDSLEVQLDTDLAGDWDSASYNADDWQIGLSPGDFAQRKPEAYIWRPALRDAASITLGARRVDDGYILEAAIPWALLDVDPNATRAVGLALNVSDDDLPEPAQMTMISSSPKRLWADPRSFGTLVLDRPATASAHQ